MLKIKRVSESVGKKVYTDFGEYFGEIEEASITDNKISGWRIRVSSAIGNLLGGARGVVIPHSFVKAVGDIFIINHASLPLEKEQEQLNEGSPELM